MNAPVNIDWMAFTTSSASLIVIIPEPNPKGNDAGEDEKACTHVHEACTKFCAIFLLPIPILNAIEPYDPESNSDSIA